jgi:hypothetical protein
MTPLELSKKRGFEPPTYKAYERSCDQFAEWRRQAACLTEAELRRHASVARLEGSKRCFACFCCAAETVLEQVTTGTWGGV